MEERTRVMLVDMPEYKRLTARERHEITLRLMKPYSTHTHPQRNAEVSKVLEQIKSELKAGRTVQ